MFNIKTLYSFYAEKKGKKYYFALLFLSFFNLFIDAFKLSIALSENLKLVIGLKVNPMWPHNLYKYIFDINTY